MTNKSEDRFERIKKYLGKIKTMDVEMEDVMCIDGEAHLRVDVTTRWEWKFFFIGYYDYAHEPTYGGRPRWHYYRVKFEMPHQSNWDGSMDVTIFDEKWFTDEEAVIDYLKYRIMKYRHLSAKKVAELNEAHPK